MSPAEQLAAIPADPAVIDRGALEQIYASPGFETARQRRADALSAWLAHLKELVLGWFETSGAASYSNVTRFLVLGLAALLAVWGLAWLWNRKRRVAAALEPTRAPGAVVLDDPSVHVGRAQALLASAPREALREAWLSLLSQLERSRLARPDRVKTNRELADELPSRGAPQSLAEGVRAAVRWYDAAYYSLGEVTAEGAARFLADVTALAASARAVGTVEPRR